MPHRTVLRVTDVSKEGDDRRILSAINWRIRRGEHWAILGANGAGKTTLLRIIAGYDWPATGSVEVLGRRFGRIDLRELRKSIGWVTSSLLTQFHEEDTALSIVASGLEASIGLWRDFKAAEFKRAERALAAIGADSVLHQPYRTLSEGECQRVMIARALINRPALLILDEPCAGLDPAAREGFLRDLTRFVRRRTAPTLIFGTHHIEEIPRFVSHALILKNGSALASGPIAGVCTGKVLGDAFDAEVQVERRDGRYQLRLKNR